MTRYKHLLRFSLACAILATSVTAQDCAFAQGSADDEAVPVEQLRQFAAAYSIVKHLYLEETDDESLFAHAISGMLAGLDPHSAYLDKDALEELSMVTTGQFTGVGVEVTLAADGMRVMSVVGGAPASRAGIRIGDLITAVDDRSVKGVGPKEGLALMRGAPGTAVRIAILRPDDNEPIAVTVTRDAVKLESVTSRWIQPGYGYIRIAQFQEDTGQSLARALRVFETASAAPLRGIVLDLRDDPGGLLTAAVAAAAAFLQHDELVTYTEGRTSAATMRMHATPADYLAEGEEDPIAALSSQFKTTPLAVLVNHGSASASELLAGALQDHGRAVVIGTRTFGKGSVQQVIPISETTVIKLTTARYFTPRGRAIQGSGVVPDVVLDEDKMPAAGAILREADLPGYLAAADSSTGVAPAAAAPSPACSYTRPSQPVKLQSIVPRSAEPFDLALSEALAYLKSPCAVARAAQAAVAGYGQP
jgi:carboxyl-terminal processing protease